MKPIQIKNIVLGEGIPKICVPLVSTTGEALLKEAEALTALPADLTEWRADCVENILKPGRSQTLLSMLQVPLKGLPLLFTFRTHREGGNCTASLEEYGRLTEEAICSGLIDLVDLELFSGDGFLEKLIKTAHSHNVKVVLSNHDFHATPPEEEIFSRLSRMEALGADIAKIAVTPRCTEDVLTLLSATNKAHKALSCPIITMSMKGSGLISRLSGELFGSCLTFGSGLAASAPGQIGAADLKYILDLLHANS